MKNSIKYLPDIDNEFGLNWVKEPNKRGVLLLPEYVFLNEGFLNDAVIFSQLIYWNTPDNNGYSRLRVVKDGHLWIAKNHEDWEEELGINRHTVRKCLDRLEDRELIIRTLGRFRGIKTPLIRINWDGFEIRMKLVLQHLVGKQRLDLEKRMVYQQFINSN